jgi:hypothetical protein
MIDQAAQLTPRVAAGGSNHPEVVQGGATLHPQPVDQAILQTTHRLAERFTDSDAYGAPVTTAELGVYLVPAHRKAPDGQIE